MSNLFFAKTHEWVLVDGDTCKVGLSAHAVEQLGDLVFVELPEVGASVFCQKPFCNVESVKAVSEVYSPVCGVVLEVNTDLESAPENLNNAPATTFIAKIKLDKQPDGLMTEAEYLEYIK